MAAKIKKPTTAQQTRITSHSVPVAPKANNVTASTASKIISKAPTVAPKANNVTAATATKNVSPSAPVTAKYTAPSTPAVSTPTYTAPSTPSYTAPSTPSYVAPSNPTPIDVTRGTTLQTPSIPDNPVQSLYDTIAENRSTVDSVQNILNSAPNETPTQRTERWLGNMGILGNANTNVARNNVIRNNANSQTRTSLEEALRDSAREALVGEDRPFVEVPNFLNWSPNNDRTVIKNDSYGNDSLRGSSSADSMREGLEDRLYGDGNAALSPDARQGFETLLDLYSQTDLPADLRYNIGARKIVDDLNNLGTPEYNVNVNTGDYEGGSSGGSGGGSRGGSGGGSTSGLAGGYNLDDLYDLINRQLAEYDNGYNTLMQNLLDAYNANFGSLNDSYLAALQALGLNYADTESLLNGRLANSQQSLEDARKRAMQEAYISRMMDQKNLEDYLGAAGLSGGATESVLNTIMNNYRSNRNKIEENTQTSLRELLQSYLDNMSNARQAYNSGILNAENNRMSAAQNLANSLYESQANAASNYSNQRANVYSNLYDTLAKLALKG